VVAFARICGEREPWYQGGLRRRIEFDAMSQSAHLTSARLLGRNTILNLLGGAAPSLVALVAIPILVHRLGYERYGVMTLAWLVAGYFSVFDMGLGRAATKLIAEALGAKEPERIAAVAWTALTMMAVLGVLGGVAMAAVSPWLVHRVLNIPPSLQAEALHTFWLLAVAFPLMISASPLSGMLAAFQRFDLINAAGVPFAFVSYMAPLVVLAFSHSIFWIVAAVVAGRAMSWGVQFFLCIRVFPPFGRRVAVRCGMLRPLFSFGGWITVSGITGPLMVHLDRFFISATISVAAVSYYSVPFQAASKMTLVPGALATVMFPALSAELAADPARAARLFDRAVTYLFIALFPAALVAAVFAPEILTIWIGSDFSARSFWVMRWIAIAAMVNGLAYLPSCLVQAAHRPDLTAKFHVAEVPVYLAGLWLGLRTFGVEGAAFVYLGRVVLDAALLYWAAARILPGVRAASMRTALRLTGGTVAIVLALGIAPLAPRAAYVTVALAGFAAWGWRTMLAPSERESVRLRLRAMMPLLSQ
jgi:O-antigen/teichoic acid export membrane protein